MKIFYFSEGLTNSRLWSVLAENVEEPFLPLHIRHTRSNNILFSPYSVCFIENW